MSATTVAKSFAWSYSRLKNFETCPERYNRYQVRKDVFEPETEELRRGNELHAHFDKRLRGVPLPLGFRQYEDLLARILAAAGQTVSEQKLAFTRDLRPCGYFDKACWYRGVVDACKVCTRSVSVFDWKTGKPNEDLTQMQLMAATLFIHMPEIERVKTGLVFVNHNEIIPGEFVREDQQEIWDDILPRVAALEAATTNNQFPPKPGGLCKRYCNVRDCRYHGVGSNHG